MLAFTLLPNAVRAEDEEQDLDKDDTKVEEKKRYDDAFYTSQGTRVVYDKFYDKDSKSEVFTFFSAAPFGSLTLGYGGGASYTYHFSDSWSWEVVNAQYVKHDFQTFVTGPLSTFTFDRFKYSMTSAAMWNGLYGKLRVLGTFILRFDYYVLAGFGAAKTDFGMKAAGEFGVGMRVFMGKLVALRAEFRDIIYPDEVRGPLQTQNEIKNNFFIVFGASFFLPTFEHVDLD
jgi:outer membrane beta-barrel protein